MAKLTDLQRKQIIAGRAEGKSLRVLAKEYGVSEYAIRYALNSDPKTSQIIAQKKEENIASVLAYMDTRSQDVCEAIGAIITAIKDPVLIAKTPMAQLATTMAILIDKFTGNELRKQAGEAEQAPDDGFMPALEKRAQELWPAGDDLTGGDTNAPQE